jgi:hypothetical protein
MNFAPIPRGPSFAATIAQLETCLGAVDALKAGAAGAHLDRAIDALRAEMHRREFISETEGLRRD